MNKIPQQFEDYIRDNKHSFNVMMHSLRMFGLSMYVKYDKDIRKAKRFEKVIEFVYNAKKERIGYKTNRFGIVLDEEIELKIK